MAIRIVNERGTMRARQGDGPHLAGSVWMRDGWAGLNDLTQAQRSPTPPCTPSPRSGSRWSGHVRRAGEVERAWS